MADLVRFGLSNVHYALKTSTGTYSQPKPLVGAVQLTTSPEGDSSNFYADNRVFYVMSSNSGYSGSLEVAAINEDFMTDCLGYEADATSGLTIETTEAQPAEVALLFEINGNTEKQRGALYGLTFQRADSENNTTTDSTEPDTVTLDFTAVGDQFTVGSATKNVVKAFCTDAEETHDAFDNFFTAVPIPGKASGAGE